MDGQHELTSSVGSNDNHHSERTKSSSSESKSRSQTTEQAEDSSESEIDVVSPLLKKSLTAKNHQGGLPLTANPPQASMLWRWTNRARDLLDLTHQAITALKATLTNTSDESGESSPSSSPDSRSGWDRVEPREIGNGQYEQFVKQQDQREYYHVEECDAKSGYSDEYEDEPLGGEKWETGL